MSANKTLPSLSQKAQDAIKSAGLDNIITSPAQSMIVRMVVGAAIAFAATRWFKVELNEQQIGDYVEIAILVVSGATIMWKRWSSTRTLKSVQEAANESVQAILGTPGAQREILQFLQKTNPRVHDVTVQLLEELQDAGSQVPKRVQALADAALALSDPGARKAYLAGLKAALDEDDYTAVVACVTAIVASQTAPEQKPETPPSE